MPLKAPFRKCVRSGNKLPAADGHSLCLLCLGESHVIETCHHCQAFSRQTRRHRADRLKAELWKQTLLQVDRPKTMATIPSSTSTDPSASTPCAGSSTSSRSLSVSTAKKLAKKAKKAKSPPASQEKAKKRKQKTAKPGLPIPRPAVTTESSNPAEFPAVELLSMISEGEIREPPIPTQLSGTSLTRRDPANTDDVNLTPPPQPPSRTESRTCNISHSQDECYEREITTTITVYSDYYANRYYHYHHRSRSPYYEHDRYSEYSYPPPARGYEYYYDRRPPYHGEHSPQ